MLLFVCTETNQFKPVKLETSRTMVLPAALSVLCSDPYTKLRQGIQPIFLIPESTFFVYLFDLSLSCTTRYLYLANPYLLAFIPSLPIFYPCAVRYFFSGCFIFSQSIPLNYTQRSQLRSINRFSSSLSYSITTGLFIASQENNVTKLKLKLKKLKRMNQLQTVIAFGENQSHKNILDSNFLQNFPP